MKRRLQDIRRERASLDHEEKELLRNCTHGETVEYISPCDGYAEVTCNICGKELT